MLVWSKQEHDVNPERGSPDTEMEVYAREGAAGSDKRMRGTGQDTLSNIEAERSLSSD